MEELHRKWFKDEYRNRKLLRNDYYHDGRWSIPYINKIDVTDILNRRWLGCDHTKSNDDSNIDKVVHFFTYDYKIEKYYAEPDKYLEVLAQYACVLTPDYSLYTDMPLALQLTNVFKSRWCGAKWQAVGLQVVPTISWSTKESYDFCFDGIETGSAVAISTMGARQSKQLFLQGFDSMKERINPSYIFCFDEPLPEIRDKVIHKSYSETARRKKTWVAEDQNQIICRIN